MPTSSCPRFLMFPRSPTAWAAWRCREPKEGWAVARNILENCSEWTPITSLFSSVRKESDRPSHPLLLFLAGSPRTLLPVLEPMLGETSQNEVWLSKYANGSGHSLPCPLWHTDSWGDSANNPAGLARTTTLLRDVALHSFFQQGSWPGQTVLRVRLHIWAEQSAQSEHWKHCWVVSSMALPGPFILLL